MWNNLIVGCLLVSSTIVCCAHGAGYPKVTPDNPLEIPVLRPADSAIAADEHTDDKFVQTVKPDQPHDDHHHHHYHGEDGKYNPKDDGRGWDIRKSVPGEPDKDYPTYHKIPQTDFSCSQKQPGAYPDIQTGCRVYRYCMSSEENSKMISFICPNGRLYDQNSKICDWWFKVKCDDKNESIIKNNVRRNTAYFNKIPHKENIVENLIPILNEDDDVKGNETTPTVNSISTKVIESPQFSIPQFDKSKNSESITEKHSALSLDRIHQALFKELYLKEHITPRFGAEIVLPKVNPNIYGSLGYNFTEHTTKGVTAHIQNKIQNRQEPRGSDNINIILAHNEKKISLDDLTKQLEVNYYNPIAREIKLILPQLSNDARKHEQNLALVGLTQIKGIAPELSLFDGPFNPNVEPIIRYTETFPKLDAKHQKLLEKFISIPTDDAYHLGLLKGSRIQLPEVSKERYVLDPTRVDIRSKTSMKQNGGEKIQNGDGLNLHRPKRIYSLEELYSPKVADPLVEHILKTN